MYNVLTQSNTSENVKIELNENKDLVIHITNKDNKIFNKNNGSILLNRTNNHRKYCKFFKKSTKFYKN